MSVIGWIDRPRNLAVSHLAGAFAIGAVVGATILAGLAADPVSHAEAKHLTVVPRPNLAFPERIMFGPYFCEDDCSGHVAGWEWARDHRAKSTEQCSGSGSTSFLEGCRFYVQVLGYEEDEW